MCVAGVSSSLHDGGDEHARGACTCAKVTPRTRESHPHNYFKVIWDFGFVRVFIYLGLFVERSGALKLMVAIALPRRRYPGFSCIPVFSLLFSGKFLCGSNYQTGEFE